MKEAAAFLTSKPGVLGVLSKWNLLIDLSVLVPDKPEPLVRHLNAPDARLLQLPVDSSELVLETRVSENQSESGS